MNSEVQVAPLKKAMKADRQQLKKLPGTTLWLTLIFLMMATGILEAITRWEVFQSPLTAPTLGSSHYELGQKLALLEAAIRKNGAADCIMVGSSMVDVGIDPEYFQTAYQETTGRSVHCFNFGIEASSAASLNVIARIMVEDYHPRILIVGTDPRDYALPLEDEDVAVLMETPWIKYRNGEFTLDGWLMEHSYFYRYRQHLGRLARFSYEDTLRSDTKIIRQILGNGFTATSTVATYVFSPPDPGNNSYEVTYYKRIFSSYQMLDLNLSSMAAILARKGEGTKIILVEMPVPDGYFSFFGNGDSDYALFVHQMNSLSGEYDVPFLRTATQEIVPKNGWSDYSHMNTTGAEHFSRWLGWQVGEVEE